MKVQCDNEKCSRKGRIFDVDFSLTAYYSEYKNPQFLIQNKEFVCVECEQPLTYLIKVKQCKSATILKTATWSKEEKVNYFKKRAHDLRIPVNKRINEFKQYKDRTND
jgi:hypothetical protein